MCGIMGFSSIGKVTQTTKEILRETLAELTVRGSHATGIAAVGEDGRGAYAKKALPGIVFARLPVFDEVMASLPGLFLGHCRWATHGSQLDNINNHPHVSANGEWLIIHNGVLHGWPKTIEEELKSECDSEVLLYYIAKYGVEAGLKQIVENVSGDYAFMAIDRLQRKMYLYRDASRPIVMTAQPEHDGVYFCSTYEILKAGFETQGVALEKKAVVELDKHKLYVIKPGEVDLTELGVFTPTAKITKYTKPHSYGGEWWKPGQHDYGDDYEAVAAKVSKPKGEKTEKTLPFFMGNPRKPLDAFSALFIEVRPGIGVLADSVMTSVPS